MSESLNPETDRMPFRFFVRVNRAVIPLVLANIVFYCLGALALLLASYFLGQVIDVLNGTSDGPLETLAMLLIVSFFLHELFVSFRSYL